ncbi:hypothetical protein GQX74_003302 [Glossina fuscipes]|nr:hypothetical protein GQX74_003302 [Glossina fuscipes]
MHCISVFSAPSEASVIQNYGKMVAPPASTYNAHTIEHAIAYSLLLQAAPTSTTVFAFTKSTTTPPLMSISPPTSLYSQIALTAANRPASSSSFNRPPGIGFLGLTYAATAFASFLYNF